MPVVSVVSHFDFQNKYKWMVPYYFVVLFTLFIQRTVSQAAADMDSVWCGCNLCEVTA